MIPLQCDRQPGMADSPAYLVVGAAFMRPVSVLTTHEADAGGARFLHQFRLLC